ncbi:MAG: hypothetical protein JAY85_11135 [Candidatus Thiodiazotropha weberae]|uniref:Uncharacterized protein n=1 Tax=Candidatus Thiodiazotropha endoloripes TaxID=1818881 RepID=A0A1E2UIZ3_9GAMM|nr:hypothetical protein [Candidatus Thiodiazotropha endoloripes]MCG7899000.1 hypothetical protein [Candidatus Thiodiazotropha weberae]MCG7901741.1 hypothetical protein [Candidatus Thiodiazotropha weberae]ODB94467.1 hypothetical protein A3196_18240 [Candidatus Thiodiazotropha endoloripes]
MKIAAFALLLSGVFTATMIPTAELKAEGGYGAAKYPFQMPAGNGSPGYGQNWQQGQPNYAGYRFPARASAYRFRPWSGERQRTVQRAAPRYAAYNQMQQSHQGYRFRPMKPVQASPQAVATPAVAYRPANITIPDNYVYRPLSPVKKAKPSSYADNSPRVYPQMPRYGYGAYQPLPVMQSAYQGNHRMINRPSPTSRYVYGNGRYSGHKFRPDHRVYAPAAYGGYGRPMMPMNRMPGYVNRGWPQPLRFRPAPQLRMPQPAYAYLPPNRYPGMVQHYPAGVAPWGRYAAPMPQAYPSWQMHPERHAGRDHKRVDWYDGHSDGEGAWYKLTQQQNWPQVSQNWAGQNSVYSQGPR